MPLYAVTFGITPEIKQGVPLFLCPSDHGQNVSLGFGPTNCAACAGSGGSPVNTDGIFYVNSHTRMPQLADGSAQFIEEEIDLTVWQAMSTRKGNETISSTEQ